jgi:HAE1 family hydrophobic/amphiphilic exporter-1
MTTTAMVFGMLPVALGFGSGGGSRAPMAITVIGGLLTSMLLTLVIVPVVYTLIDDLGGLKVPARLPGFRRQPRSEPVLGEAGTGEA